MNNFILIETLFAETSLSLLMLTLVFFFNLLIKTTEFCLDIYLVEQVKHIIHEYHHK